MIPEPITIEGIAFSRSELLDRCKEICHQAGEPEWRREIYDFLGLFLGKGELDLVQFTSGTTGDPKKVSLTREAMLLSARRTLDYLDLQAGDSALLCLPVRYIAGKMMVVRALLGGMNLVIRDPSGRPLEGVKEELSFAAMVPLQIYESLKHGDPLFKISKLIIGGGDLAKSLEKELARVKSPEAYLTFGMTETCTHFALKRINGSSPQTRYMPMEGVELSQDHRACLVVNVPGITQSPVITNDLVEMDESHKGFAWKGRYDNVINSGGIKIIPELVEQKACLCTGEECLVLSETDPKLGERLVLLVEYPTANPPTGQWLSCLKNSLSAYEIPKRIITVAEMPRNNSLKPDRTSAARLLL